MSVEPTNSVVEDIASYLEEQGCGRVGVDIIQGMLSDSPDTAIGIIEYSGMPADYIQEQAFAAIEKPRVQVLVRGLDYALTRALVQQAYRALDSVRNLTIAGTRYLMTRPIQSPFLLERDTNARVVFCFNAECWKAVV